MGGTESHNVVTVKGNGCGEWWKQRQQGGEALLSSSGRGRREESPGDGAGLRSYSLFAFLLIKKGWTKHQGNNLSTIK